VLKGYNEFLNEIINKNRSATKNWDTKGSASKKLGKAAVALKMAEVPVRITRQLIRFAARKDDIKKMVQQAETREEKAKLKKELFIMSRKEFKLKKQAQLAKKKAKADKK
tara:strand:- start:1261 stop:1590 length:330 start_codon:yes stop_codon:yes gene_type:complete